MQPCTLIGTFQRNVHARMQSEVGCITANRGTNNDRHYVCGYVYAMCGCATHRALTLLVSLIVPLLLLLLYYYDDNYPYYSYHYYYCYYYEYYY